MGMCVLECVLKSFYQSTLNVAVITFELTTLLCDSGLSVMVSKGYSWSLFVGSCTNQAISAFVLCGVEPASHGDPPGVWPSLPFTSILRTRYRWVNTYIRFTLG